MTTAHDLARMIDTIERRVTNARNADNASYSIFYHDFEALIEIAKAAAAELRRQEIER